MREELVKQIEDQWKDERWQGIERPYTAEDVLKLRGSDCKLNIHWQERLPRNYGTIE